MINIVNGVINEQITTEEIFKWLTTDDPHDVNIGDVVQTKSTRAEFVLFFLDYLRKQCQGVLSTRSADGEVPQKKVAPSSEYKSREGEQSALVHDRSNNSCHTSTPLKTIENQSYSFENKSGSFNTSMHTSPIARNDSSFDQSFPSPQLDGSFHNASVTSNFSNLSSVSTPFSPVSPLYVIPVKRIDKPLNRSTNSWRSNSGDQNSSGRMTVQLGDLIAASSSRKPKRNPRNPEASIENTSGENLDSSKNKRRRARSRRIKPTQLQVSSEPGNIQGEVFGVISRPETKNPQFLEAQTNDKCKEVTSFEAERELLKLERQRQPRTDPVVSPNPPEAKGIPVVSSTTPKLDLVDNMKVLDKLAELYGNLIGKNFVPNPMTELYFIMTLLTTQLKSQDQKGSMSLKQLKETMGCKDIDGNGEELEERYLNTPHNCVYFATTVLTSQKELLVVLDRATIKLLYNNNHIMMFRPELRSYLNQLYDSKVEESNRFREKDNSAVSGNVCFQIETDNHENFPSKIAFSNFRIQRDLFYEALKIWEDKHLQRNWSFAAALTKRINAMLSLHDDPANYYHLAKLFRSQLLASSIQFGHAEEPIDDETFGVLKSLRDLNIEKFKQLQERLVTPQSSAGPVPAPSFPGVQEFYRDFLLMSANGKFNVVLENSFIQEIVELNETPFGCCELKNQESTIDESTKQKYLVCISSLRILAKFLGFLVSIPFQSQSSSLTVMNSQIALRSQVSPSLNLQSCLRNALIQEKLTLTVPWLVEYLAMLDAVALRLPYYTKICEILYCIYRAAGNYMTRKGALLTTFSVGWLFELPNFPRDLYFTWQINFNDQSVKQRFSRYMTDTDRFDPPTSEVKKPSGRLMDSLELVDDRAILSCCPFLKEFKILLTSGGCNFGSSNVNRHITPVSSQLSQPSSETKAKLLQLQQEDAFFHGQPDSVKKTVDFVSERVASNCVKHICRQIIPSIKKRHFKAFKKSSDNLKKDKLTNEAASIISLITRDLREQCDTTMPKICEKRCRESIAALLAEDTHPAVTDMCTKIALRLAVERVDQWLDLTTKEIHSEYLLFSPKEETVEVRKCQHNPAAPSPTVIISEIRDSMWELVEKNGMWSALNKRTVTGILTRLSETLNGRMDLMASVEKVVYVLTVDYAIHLIVFSELFTSTVEDQFVAIWRQHSDDAALFGGILSFRNVRLLMPVGKAVTWKTYGSLIRRLLKEKLLTIESFSDQCVALLRWDWPAQVTKFLPKCLNEAIVDYRSEDEHTEKIKLLLDWIADVCKDLPG